MAEIGIIMGSISDWETMEHACKLLEELDIPYEKEVISAHRTPEDMFEYASSARDRGLKVIIAGAGGAAHLPGMVASKTTLPVIGVPVQTKALDGMDSLLSIVQMPGVFRWLRWQSGKPAPKMPVSWQRKCLASMTERLPSA